MFLRSSFLLRRGKQLYSDLALLPRWHVLASALPEQVIARGTQTSARAGRRREERACVCVCAGVGVGGGGGVMSAGSAPELHPHTLPFSLPTPRLALPSSGEHPHPYTLLPHTQKSGPPLPHHPSPFLKTLSTTHTPYHHHPHPCSPSLSSPSPSTPLPPFFFHQRAPSF